MVSLIGEAGVGKSRLVAELKQCAGSQLSVVSADRDFPLNSVAADNWQLTLATGHCPCGWKAAASS